MHPKSIPFPISIELYEKKSTLMLLILYLSSLLSILTVALSTATVDFRFINMFFG